MWIHRSNRIEALVRRLVKVVAQPLADPFAADCIVVQGRGMERWLSMQLAQNLGIWANPDFPFPRRVIEQAIDALGGEARPDIDVFAPETLRWAIASLLPELLERPALEPIRAYLGADGGVDVRVGLATHLAGGFDRYATYRADLLAAWQRGQDPQDWQAVLWRALVGRHGKDHPGARLERLRAALRRGTPLAGGVPARLCLFGLSTLPPAYLDAFHALAAQVDVHLFILSPSHHYWADMRSRLEQLRLRRRADAGAPLDEAALAAGEGHPLLLSLGRLGREFQQVLEEVEYRDDGADLYEDPGEGDLLAALQSDIMHLTLPSAEARRALAVDDRSIVIHACHGPMREVEVLHDHLTAAFEADPTLEPRDVLVMTPSIEEYAPYVDAVFGIETPGGRTRIPYRFADRPVRANSEVADAFAALLVLLRGRLTAAEVLDVLRREPVRARFAIAGDDLELVRHWITETGICWGVDAAHRAAHDQPAVDDNTWRFGLDRLLLGYAMPGDGLAQFGETLPYEDVEGGESVLLGRLADFCAALFAAHAALAAPRPLASWRDELGRLLERLIARTPATAHQHELVRAALAALAARAEAAGFAEPVALETVCAQLDDELQRGATAQGFLSGGVTICELLPMRSIPFKVVYLLGMNDEAFPRQGRPLGFDRIAAQPRPGDRSVRDDDRYLFLEALLAARQQLVISYVGQRITDNQPLPPSVVVQELLDTIERTVATPDGAPVAAQIVVAHPLQPFSPRYFRGAEQRLFSYSELYRAGATALGAPPSPPPPFVDAPLPLPASTPRRVEVDALARFFEHPVRAFVQQRLLLYLGREVEPLAARQPLELDQLDTWQVGDNLLRHALAGDDAQAVRRALLRRGTLPPGTLGRYEYLLVRPQAAEIAAAAHSAAAALEPLPIDAVVGGTQLTGLLRDLWPDARRRVQFSRAGGHAELGFWVRHLLLNCFAPDGYPRVSRLLARAPKGTAVVRVEWAPVADAAACLQGLLELYWRGLERPLPLFRNASPAYARRRLKQPADLAGALDAARVKYAPSSDDARGDCDDPYVRQVFGDGDLLDLRPDGGDEFARLAMQVWGPLLAARSES